MLGILCNRDVLEISNLIGNPREQARKGAGMGEDFMIFKNITETVQFASAATARADMCSVERNKACKAVVS